MDTNKRTKLEGARLARASAAGALCALAVIASVAPHRAQAQTTLTDRQKAVLLHQRLTGVPPSAANLDAMTPLIATNPAGAAAIATSQDQFYNVTLKNLFLPAT